MGGTSAEGGGGEKVQISSPVIPEFGWSETPVTSHC